MLYAGLAAWPDIDPLFYWQGYDGNIPPTLMPTDREACMNEVLDETCPTEVEE